MIKRIGLMFFVLTTSVMAQNSSLNLAIPTSPSTFGQDRIRTAEGLECNSAIGGATQLELGMTGIVDNYQSPFGGSDISRMESKDIGVYARIVIPLDAPKERLNCNSLYKLELRKKRLEVMRLQEELIKLRQMNENGNNFEFEN
jgi:hypothetical protein